VVTTTQGYQPDYGEPNGYTASVNGTAVYGYTLYRDLSGRIFQKVETTQGTTDTWEYGYDDAGRLWTVTRNGALQSVYGYDPNGNRLQKSVAGGAESGSYDDQDRMTSYGSAVYTYRPNGELESRSEGGQTTLYDYDAMGNLRGVGLPGGAQVEYLTDARNRRIGKKVNGAPVEGFLYEGQLRPAAWLDGAGNVKARFVYGLRVNVPEYVVTTTGTYRVVTDHLGSPRLVVDASSGAVAQRVDYDELGQVTYDSNPGFQPFGFAGGLYDRDTGLVRFGARDYDSRTGRWTNKDPIRFNGGDGNVYAYVRNDPVNFIDPLGLRCRSYWQRVGDNFILTNKAIPGLLAPMGLGLLTTGPIAQAIGGMGPLAWAWSGFGGATLGGVSWTALETSAIVGATTLTSWAAGSLAFELGVGIGSLVEAAFEDGGKCDGPCGG